MLVAPHVATMADDGKQRCSVCGADITGLRSLERPGVATVQRLTCFDSDECADRLMVVRDAWRALALLALAPRRSKAKIQAAIDRLFSLGEE
jgi:hypothetical protein